MLQTQAEKDYGLSSPIHQVAGLRLAERTYSAGFQSPSHSHPEGYFCLILDGTSKQTYGSKSRVRVPLTTAFYPPNEVQSELFGHTGGRIFKVEADSLWLNRFREYFVIREESVDFRGGAVAWLMSKLYYEFRRMDQTSPLVIEGLTLEIIAEASRKCAASQTSTPRWLSHAKDILHDNLADSLTLARIAEMVGVHPVYLASTFRRHFHCTIGDYRRRLRIEFACREICKPHSSLAQVALAAGFANQAHFSRVFKRLMGVTPAEYRENSPRS